MRRLSYLLVAAMAVATLDCAHAALAADLPQQAVAGEAAVRDRLISLERRSWVAWQNHDGAYFDRFLSADHVEVGPRGVTDKASVVAGVSSPACKVDGYALGDMQYTRIAADTAVLVYRAEQMTTCGGVNVPSPAWATSVYVERDGQWQNILYQQTPAAPG